MNIGQRKVDEKTIHQYLLVKLDSKGKGTTALNLESTLREGYESEDRSIYSLFDTSIYQRNNVNMLLVDIF